MVVFLVPLMRAAKSDTFENDDVMLGREIRVKGVQLKLIEILRN